MDSDRDEDELEGYYYDPLPGDPDFDALPDDRGYDSPDGAAGYDEPPSEPRKVVDPSAYWRRRFFVLAAGIVALGLCAWLIPGAHRSAETDAAAQESAAALATRNTLPSAAYGPAYAPKPAIKPSPTVSETPASAVTKQPAGPAGHPGASPSPSNSPSLSATGAPNCAPHDIVLSLFTTAASYPQQALPTFDVYAVSTSATACTMVYGPGAVQVVVTRQGHVVWDSAACQLPPGSPVRLTLGVPHELTVSWNRQATAPAGCGGVLPAGASGTFDVVAMAEGQSSPVRTFSLEKS
jgi:hypothetical protein